MQISKWGNSLAVRLPKALVEELGLKEGDEVELVARTARVLEIEKRFAAEKLLSRMAKYRGSLPAGYKFNRVELYERRSDDED